MTPIDLVTEQEAVAPTPRVRRDRPRTGRTSTLIYRGVQRTGRLVRGMVTTRTHQPEVSDGE